MLYFIKNPHFLFHMWRSVAGAKRSSQLKIVWKFEYDGLSSSPDWNAKPNRIAKNAWKKFKFHKNSLRLHLQCNHWVCLFWNLFNGRGNPCQFSNICLCFKNQADFIFSRWYLVSTSQSSAFLHTKKPIRYQKKMKTIQTLQLRLHKINFVNKEVFSLVLFTF